MVGFFIIVMKNERNNEIYMKRCAEMKFHGAGEIA